MKEDNFAKNYHKYKNKIKEKWNRLTDNDLNKINGKRDQLIHSLQEHYGWQRPQAEMEVKNWEHSMCEKCEECEGHHKRKAS